MARRRKRRQPDAFDFIEGLLGPIAALVFLLILFAPQVLRVIVGSVLFIIVIAAAGVVLAIIWRAFRGERARQENGAPSTQFRVETTRPSVYLDPYKDVTWPKNDPVILPRLEEKLRAIDWFQFEKVVSAIYEVRGYKVTRLGGAKPDGGIDLIVEGEGERAVVQCKHWRKWTVGVRHVRELLGTLTDANIKQGVLVTLRGCTQEAKDFAKKHGIVIVEEAELVKLMEMKDGSVNQRIAALLDDKRKYCPKCEGELVIRTATKGFNRGGQFWGCTNYPRCRYILRNA